MSFLNTLKSLTNKASSEISDQFNRIKNKEIMEAVVAACTYVSYSDGRVSPEEKNKMLGFLQNSECLKMYKPESVVETFGKFSRKFEFDKDMGITEVFKALGGITKTEEKKLIVRACIMIANSDGNFDQNEKEAVRKICKELSLDSFEFI